VREIGIADLAFLDDWAFDGFIFLPVLLLFLTG
jgi:hypothetical protein